MELADVAPHKPGALPALRPTTACSLGPTPAGALALVAWQTAHWALNSLPPAAASPAMAGLAISIAASAAAIVVAVFIMLFLFRTPPR